MLLKTSIFMSLLILVTLAFPGCTLIIPQATTSNLPPQIKSFTINPTSIESGQSAILFWEVSNAGSVKIEPNLQAPELSGSHWVNPDQTTDYTIIASNEFGTSKSMLTLSVIEPAPAALSEPPTIISFKATPELIWAGAAVTLSWEVINATLISLESDCDDSYTVNDASGSIILQPFLPTAYVLIAKNVFGSSEFKTMVKIRKDEGVSGGSGGGSGDVSGGGGG